ncbi:MAG: PAS domain S-box protein [Sedimentisphaerales bacterium]|nr:PAS domain S-box protein [Sedimentisphaerales bacterium]
MKPKTKSSFDQQGESDNFRSSGAASFRDRLQLIRRNTHFGAFFLRQLKFLPFGVLFIVALFFIVKNILISPKDAQHFREDILAYMLLTASGLGLVSVWIARRVSRHFRNQCQNFQKQFEAAVASGEPIRRETLDYEEFDIFRQAINRMLDALGAKEDRFRGISECMTDWIWEVDAQGRYTYSSNRVKDYLGYTPDEVLGKTPFDFMEPEEVERVGKLFQQFIRKEESFTNLENWNLTKEGRRICLLTNGVPILDRQGTFIGYRGVDTNITQQKLAEEALQEEQNKLRTITEIMDGMEAMLSIQDRNYTIIYQNDLMARSNGGLGGKCYRVYEKKDQVCEGCPVAKAFEDGQIHSSEREVEKKEGGIGCFDITAIPVKGTAGEITYCVEVVRDITEQKWAQEALEQSEKRSRTLLDANPTGIVVIDAETHVFLDANSAALDMIGASREDVLGHKCEKYICPGEPGQCPMSDSEEKTNKAERVLRKANGGEMPILKTVVPIELGGCQCYLESFVDITERKQAEDTLQEEKNKLRSIINAIDGMDGMLTIQDRDYNIIYQNSIAERVFNGGLGEKCYKIYEGKDKVCEGCPVEMAFRDGKSHTSEREVTVLGDEGEITYFDNTAHPVRNAAGEITSCVEMVRNVTERKWAQKMRERFIDQQSQLNRLQQELLGPGGFKDKLQKVTDGVVQIFDADFCRVWITKPGDLCDSGCIHAHVTEGPHVCQNPDQCLHLVTSSGRYTHIDGQEHRRVPFGGYLIGRIASMEESKFLTNEAATDEQIHNHDWVRELGLTSFAGYQLHMSGGTTTGVLALFSKHPITPEEDVLLENLANATAQVIQRAQAEEKIRQLAALIEQTPEGIAVADLEGKVLFLNSAWAKMHGYEYGDELLGEHLKIFHTEEQLQSEVLVFNEQVKKHGHCTAEIGHVRKDGTTFPTMMIITLLKDEQGTPYALAGSAHDITERKHFEQRKTEYMEELKKATCPFNEVHLSGRVLVAEDDDMNQMVISDMLRKMGLQITIVDNGRKAVERATSESYDLILMDMHMPELDGHVATETLRQKGLTLPIIAFTASVMETEIKQCYDAGCDDFIAKPVDMDELCEKLMKYLPQNNNPTVPQAPGDSEKVVEFSHEAATDHGSAEEQIEYGCIDLEELHKRVNNEALIQSMFSVFLYKYPSKVEQLGEAVKRANCEAVRSGAHGLKGAAASIGAKPLSQAAYALECAGREGHQEIFETLFETIETEFENLRTFISRMG